MATVPLPRPLVVVVVKVVMTKEIRSTATNRVKVSATTAQNVTKVADAMEAAAKAASVVEAKVEVRVKVVAKAARAAQALAVEKDDLNRNRQNAKVKVRRFASTTCVVLALTVTRVTTSMKGK